MSHAHVQYMLFNPTKGSSCFLNESSIGCCHCMKHSLQGEIHVYMYMYICDFQWLCSWPHWPVRQLSSLSLWGRAVRQLAWRREKLPQSGRTPRQDWSWGLHSAHSHLAAWQVGERDRCPRTLPPQCVAGMEPVRIGIESLPWWLYVYIYTHAKDDLYIYMYMYMYVKLLLMQITCVKNVMKSGVSVYGKHNNTWC